MDMDTIVKLAVILTFTLIGIFVLCILAHLFVVLFYAMQQADEGKQDTKERIGRDWFDD